MNLEIYLSYVNRMNRNICYSQNATGHDEPFLVSCEEI